ncbi:MAG: substrate-binding domain-containing protein [Treponema sp.]|jgi:ribose transport system substrate-binding protein|nr:substrate-binding domain-containing protein [Treponema sp.]
MKIRKVFLLVGILILVSGTAVFAGGGSQNTGGEKKLRIGISVIGTEHSWDINAYNGARDKARELGFEILGFDGERRPEKQLSDVETLISSKVDIIAVILGDTESLAPALKKARDQGIPVVTADFDNPHTIANVGTNNQIAMAELVEQLCADLGKNGNVGVFYTPGIPIADERKDVFDKVMAKYSGMKVVNLQPWKIPGTVPDAYDKTKDMMKANPEIQAFWTVFDQPMIGAAQALADVGLQGKTKCYGFDGDDLAMEMLMDPNAAYGATVAQQPYLIGQTLAEVAWKVLHKEPVDRNVYVPAVLVTPKNVKEVYNTLPQYKK